MMDSLNSRYGWHITVSSSMRGRKLTDPEEAARVHTYVVLALVLDTGERMLSVVNPKAAHDVDLMARSTRRIVDHRWYMTQDAFFSTYPKVRSLRACRVTKDVYNEKTAAMQPLSLRQESR